MKKQAKSTGFWSHGAAIFWEELAKEEAECLSPLEAELKTTSDPSRMEALKQQIEAIKEEFKDKRKSARHSLFAGR